MLLGMADIFWIAWNHHPEMIMLWPPESDFEKLTWKTIASYIGCVREDSQILPFLSYVKLINDD